MCGWNSAEQTILIALEEIIFGKIYRQENPQMVHILSTTNIEVLWSTAANYRYNGSGILFILVETKTKRRGTKKNFLHFFLSDRYLLRSVIEYIDDSPGMMLIKTSIYQ